MDIDIKSEHGNFKYRVAGILFDKNNRLLIQKIANNPFYCLPGGHVEIGETAIEAAEREINEELQFNVKVKQPLFEIENIFKNAKNKTVHEIGLYFELSCDCCPTEDWTFVENDKGILKTLTYKWTTKEELKNIDFRPKFLKNLIFDSFEQFKRYTVKNDQLK